MHPVIQAAMGIVLIGLGVTIAVFGACLILAAVGLIK